MTKAPRHSAYAAGNVDLVERETGNVVAFDQAIMQLRT